YNNKLTVCALSILNYHSFCFFSCVCSSFSFFFFFNDPSTTEIYTLSLHDALPICRRRRQPVPRMGRRPRLAAVRVVLQPGPSDADRKSTRLNSSHDQISYAVFCLKKKKKKK